LIRRLTFTADFDWRPPEAKGRIVIAYRAGSTRKVRKNCAAAAIAAGAAIQTKGNDDATEAS
jgi:hypothetical protein